jgi:subtilisin family serine protease
MRTARKSIAGMLAIALMVTMIPFYASAETGSSAAPQKIVVTFKDTTKKEAAAVIKSNGDQTEDMISNDAEKIALVDTDDPNALKEYRNEDGVVKAEKQTICTPLTAATNDTYSSRQWYLSNINASAAWDEVAQAHSHEKVKVAIVDTGVLPSHEDLGNIDVNYLYDAVNKQTLTKDLLGHGTHVTGIVGATSNNSKGIAGVASGKDNSISDLMDINVFEAYDNNGTTAYGAYSDVIYNGVKYAVDSGAKVINLSLGSTGDGDDYLEAAMKYAKDKDVLVVCAAGNEGSAEDGNPVDSPAVYAGTYDNVMSIIATDSSNTKAEYSNYGHGYETLSAPGSSLYSTYYDGGYVYMSGTSMASPVVTGVAAMMFSVYPDLTAAEAKSILCSTATDLNETGYDADSGYGLVNASAAVKKAEEKNYPEITAQPQSALIHKEAANTFSVTADKADSYQWYKDSNAVSGATTSSYEATEEGSYYCEISNAYGSVKSDTVTLSYGVGPSITAQPQSAIIKQGNSSTFSVTASGTDLLTYQWYKDNNAISDATSSSYKATEEGSYYCKISNDYGEIISDTASLSYGVGPSITAQPQSAIIKRGNSSTFSVTASGTDPLTYQWYKDGSVLGGATASSYEATEEGAYYCVVSNACDSIVSETAKLEYETAPLLMSQSLSKVIVKGTYDELTVTAAGPGLVMYQWYKDGAALVGATTSSYEATEEGSYYCEISNAYGSVVSNTVVLSFGKAPVIKKQKIVCKVKNGSRAKFSLTASGAASYQWQIRKGKTWKNISKARKSAYKTQRVSPKMKKYRYRCIIKNQYGRTVSKSMRIVIR